MTDFPNGNNSMSFKLLLKSLCTGFTPFTLLSLLVVPGKMFVCFNDTSELRRKHSSKDTKEGRGSKTKLKY